MRRRIDAADVLAFTSSLPPRTKALQYLVTDRPLHIFVVDANGVTVRANHVERMAVEEKVNAFVEMLANGDLRVESPGRALYSLLIEPIAKEIAFAEALLVIPDDGLWRVPVRRSWIAMDDSWSSARPFLMYRPCLHILRS